MYLMGKYSQLDLAYQIYISSIIRIVVTFIGHNLVTFRGSVAPLWKRAIKFFPWEIFSLVIIAQMLLFINKLVEGSLKGMTQKDLDSEWFTKLMVEKNEDGELIIKDSIIIISKQLLMVLFYFVIDMRVYKYIF